MPAIQTLRRVLGAQRRGLAIGANAASLRRKAVAISQAPKSIGEIPDRGFATPDDAVFIREIGCTRRVFQLKPYLTPRQLEGLAYRIRTLTKNAALNSVLIAKDAGMEEDGMPAMVHDRNYPYRRQLTVDPGFPPTPDHQYFVSGGCHPLQLYEADAQDIDAYLNHLSDLTLAVRGDNTGSKVPTVSIPHGHFHDGAFALYGAAGYVLATRETSFSIDNPSKGLSLDPVGLSYILPRLGLEFGQPAGDYIGCGMILGLTGYKANAADMMETGLATNYLETAQTMGLIEQSLSEMRPWNQQNLIKNPIRYHGDPETTRDHNADYRNLAIADLLHCFTSYRADGREMWTHSDADAYAIGQDPSVDFEGIPWHETRSSTLVDYAATFDDIFRQEATLVGILERFKEVASKTSEDPEEQEGIDVAKEFCVRLQSQSPLAVQTVFRLLKEGGKTSEGLRSCLAREKLVQSRLFQKQDFKNWAKHQGSKGDDDSTFQGWKHSHISEVSEDEVEELMLKPPPDAPAS